MAQIYIEANESLLLTELHHRLFNSFQIIAGGLALAQRSDSAENAVSAISDLSDRVRAFASLYRMLALPFGCGLFEDRCRSICIELVRAFGREDVSPWVRIDDEPLDPRQEQYVALLIVEFVTNALKHSLAQEGGTVWVDLHPHPAGLQLTVCDSLGRQAAPGPVPRIASLIADGLQGEAFVIDQEGYTACARFPRVLVSVAPAAAVIASQASRRAGSSVPRDRG